MSTAVDELVGAVVVVAVVAEAVVVVVAEAAVAVGAVEAAAVVVVDAEFAVAFVGAVVGPAAGLVAVESVVAAVAVGSAEAAGRQTRMMMMEPAAVILRICLLEDSCCRSLWCTVLCPIQQRKWIWSESGMNAEAVE